MINYKECIEKNKHFAGQDSDDDYCECCGNPRNYSQCSKCGKDHTYEELPEDCFRREFGYDD